MKYSLHVVCSTTGCGELVEVKKHDEDKHYCVKCEKKSRRKKT